jgi:hypothetical protein
LEKFALKQNSKFQDWSCLSASATLFFPRQEEEEKTCLRLLIAVAVTTSPKLGSQEVDEYVPYVKKSSKSSSKIWPTVLIVLADSTSQLINTWKNAHWRNGTYDLLHMFCYIWFVTYDLLHMICYIWFVTYDLSHMICHIWFVIYDLLQMICYIWFVHSYICMNGLTFRVTWCLSYQKWHICVITNICNFHIIHFSCF